MSSTDIQVQQIEQNIKDSQVLVDMGDALVRLRNNRDFQKVIQKGYFEEEAIRLVMAKADPSMQSLESQKSIVSQIDAIGSLASYFQTVIYKAQQAAKAIAYDTEMRDEILAAGDEE